MHKFNNSRPHGLLLAVTLMMLSACAARPPTLPTSGVMPSVIPPLAASDAIGVLADVLGRADRRAGVLASVADAARAAGLQCQLDYEAIALQAHAQPEDAGAP